MQHHHREPPGQQPWHGACRWRSRRNPLPRRTHHLPALLIVLLILIQNFELHMCRQLMAHPKDKHLAEVTLPRVEASEDRDREQDKRAGGRSAPSQPEEIFSAPVDDGGLSYDEYPMVVPKRAALLLDRLMVALHHALEHERAGHRIGDFYADKNNLNDKLNEYQNGLAPQPNGDDGNMYSEDDPGIVFDYDFKDVNQINRATGETLMAKSFQRRAGATSERSGSGASPPSGQRRLQSSASGSGGGRMYWRCYFNAVSCF
ncbi:hypothetical protein KR018_000280 [Drosophila ironensis]|nr:hypothetical protein KR018_000280 [Drosophila ironensis]